MSSKSISSDFSDKSTREVDEDGGEEAAAAASTFQGKLAGFLRKQGKAFVRNFVDYGPPYSSRPYDVALVNECAKPVLNHFEVHKMLNTRLNPNLPDPEDLYYTPLHWCARNAHYLGIKMLRRAGAKSGVTNEMGVTPLELAVMMKHPPDRRKDQLKCVRYLLEECEAEVNTRDKGGYSPIDHAAVNQDLEIILMLLERGANVMRENYVFVGSRHHILRRVHDPECYKVLYEKLIAEENEAFAKQIKQQQRNFLLEEEKKHDKLHIALNKKKQRRLQRQKLLEDSQQNEEVMGHRLGKIKDEMEKNLSAQSLKSADHGIWTKDFTGHWEFQPKRFASVTTSGIYDNNKRIMTELQEKNSVDRFNKVWRKVTDKGTIELPWHKSDPFKLTDDRPITSSKTDTISLQSLQSLSQDVDYRDENDQELDGEDLDDLLQNLQSL